MQSPDGGTSVGGFTGKQQVTWANDSSQNDPLAEMDEGPFGGKSGRGDSPQKESFRGVEMDEKKHISANISMDQILSQNSYINDIRITEEGTTF